ncbi:MAG: hypothetical protein WBW93_16165 [Steroidobacteraceae bacterium]
MSRPSLGIERPLGLQLYTLGEAPYRDLEGTLEAVARIGYRTVETVGLMKRTASELRAALDRAGLRRTLAAPGKEKTVSSS